MLLVVHILAYLVAPEGHHRRNAREALRGRPELDRDATSNLAGDLFPGEQLDPLDDGDLSYTCPPGDELCIGCFPGVSVVAAKEFGIDQPETIPLVRYRRSRSRWKSGGEPL